MAKPPREPVEKPVEQPVVLMRKVGPERFEVVSATLRGTLHDVKQLEKSVSLAVGRGTARKALDEVYRKLAANLGLSVDV